MNLFAKHRHDFGCRVKINRGTAATRCYLVQELVVPILAYAHGADRNATLTRLNSLGQTFFFVTIGLPIGQKNQMVDRL